MVYGEEEVTKWEEGVLSWSELIRLGNSTSDTTLDSRLATIAINQVSKIIYYKFNAYVGPWVRQAQCLVHMRDPLNALCHPPTGTKLGHWVTNGSSSFYV